MTELTFNLSFDGRCEEAFRFYEKLFDGTIQVMMTWGDSPMAKDVPSTWANKITHASMTIGNQQLTGGDTPKESYHKPQGFNVLINFTNTLQAEKAFAALAENGSVRIPLNETFWAARFGVVADQFGTPWMINCGKPESQHTNL